MAEKLLINVSHEETRVALVESGVLTNLEIDTINLTEAKGNIYKGIVHRVNPSLQAAFVDYGAEKQGFLPISELHPRFYPAELRGKRVPIQDVLREGQELMVQVVKDEIGNKGASLSTYVSLPGRYLVLMAETDKSGISRRLPQAERQRLKEIRDRLPVPEGFGLIIRTAGVERSEEELEQDLEYLRRLWSNLEERFKKQRRAGQIHKERSIALRFIRDYATPDLDEIITDDKETHAEIKDFCTILMPEMKTRVRHYEDTTPLFSRYQIEDQIDDIFARRIDLPSGGYVIIDQTEALVAVDVNSGRVKTDDIEQTALTTNLEAAEEVARQLKIRDLGGLIVVDFIDMRERKNNRQVEQAARDAFAKDKAKVKFEKISDFGLMEISRQRLKSSIMKGSFDACSHCGGTGKLRSVESSALYLLRRIKETVLRANYMHCTARLPVDIANYVLNTRRRDLLELEAESNTTIVVRGEKECPPNAAFVELLSRSSRGRRPKRVLQKFDLVRSDVDKQELQETDEIILTAAVARGVSLDAEEYDKLYRRIEEDMARQIEMREQQAEEKEKRHDERMAERQRREEERHQELVEAAKPPPPPAPLPPPPPPAKPGIFVALWRFFFGKGGYPEGQAPIYNVTGALPAPPEESKSSSSRRDRDRDRDGRDGRRSSRERGGRDRGRSSSSNRDRSSRRDRDRNDESRSKKADEGRSKADDSRKSSRSGSDRDRSRSKKSQSGGSSGSGGSQQHAKGGGDDASDEERTAKRRRRRRRRKRPGGEGDQSSGAEGQNKQSEGGSKGEAKASSDKPSSDAGGKDKGQAKAESKPRAESKPKVERKPKAESKPDTGDKPKPKPKPKSDASPKTGSEAGEAPTPQPKPKPKPKPKADAAPVAKAPVAKPDAKDQPKAKPVAESRPAAAPRAAARPPAPRPGGVIDLRAPRAAAAPAPKPRSAAPDAPAASAGKE